MAKKDNGLIVILVVIGIIAVFLLGNKFGLFSITGNEVISRSYPSIVDPGASFTVTYTVTGGSGTWGASVMDTISCKNTSANGAGYPIEGSGITQRFVMISDAGTTVTKTFSVPNKMALTCTFIGDYQFGNKTLRSLPVQTVLVRGQVCTSGADTNNDGVVDRAELGIVITGWVANTVTRDKLGLAIMEWANGCLLG